MDNNTGARNSIAVEGRVDFLLENTYLHADGLKHSSTMVSVSTANISYLEDGSYPKLNVMYGKNFNAYPASQKTIAHTNESCYACDLCYSKTSYNGSCFVRSLRRVYCPYNGSYGNQCTGEKFPHQLSFFIPSFPVLLCAVARLQETHPIQLQCCRRPRHFGPRAHVIRDISKRNMSVTHVQKVYIHVWCYKCSRM